MTESGVDKVLITGANGFVGSRLCRLLRDRGYQVIAGIRRGCDLSLIGEMNLPCRYGDVALSESLPEMVRGVDYIIHNAGVVKAKNPQQFMAVNRIGTRNILKAAASNIGLKKFIFISSAAASGPSVPGNPRAETDPPHPITEYGRSKLAGEAEVEAMKDELRSIIIRPPAIYGPGDIEMFSFFQLLNNRIRPYLGDPRRRIQLVHVDDLCRGISLAIKAEVPSGSRYFIAEERSYSLAELVGHLRHAVGRAAFPIYLPGWALNGVASISERVMKLAGKTPMLTVEKASELLENWEFSTAAAERDLGYKSEKSFADGARETYWWYLEEGWL